MEWSQTPARRSREFSSVEQVTKIEKLVESKWEQIFYSKIEKPLARKIASNTIDALDLGTWAIHSILRRLTNPIKNL